MADKEQTKHEASTEKTTSVPIAASRKEITVVTPRHSRKWVIGFVAGVVVLYIIVMIAGFLILRGVDHARTLGANGPTNATRQFNGGPGRVSGDRTFRSTSTSSDGLTATSTTTTYTQTQGVVTAVNSDNIVVAGGGKTQTIKTNSSTTYVDDTKAAVNDTVVVVGTKDGDTITATQIAVYN